MSFYSSSSSISVNPKSYNYPYRGHTVRPVQLPHQNITLTFTTTDETSNVGLGVTVTDYEGIAHTGTTDENGQVTLSNVSNGTATVSVSNYRVATSSIFVTSSAKSFNISCMYMSLGVFIYTGDRLITSSDWATSGKALSDVVGIAVVTADHQFVIAPESLGSKKIYNSQKACTGLSAITSDSVAKQRFEGAADTDVMVLSSNYGTDTTYAAGAAKAYSRGDKSWYLPSCGELQVAYDNKAAVDAALSACGATAMDTSNYHWTSTYYGPYSSYFRFWVLGWGNGDVNSNRVDGDRHVRPFCAF